MSGPGLVLDAGSKMRSAASEEAALEDLHRLGCTDGLPVIIPTVSRVDRMVLAGGMGPDLSLGTIGPLDGSATVRSVAICAVMAGCRPDYFPVVLAAVSALCDPVLDIGEVQVTTHNAGPMIVVNGPARYDCGPFESGTGALGPGNQANASVGRAIRLCLLNIGGARPGIADMALTGQPAKFTFCLAEAEEDSPFPPLHVRLGYDAGQSVVTLLTAEAPRSLFCQVTEDVADCSDRLLRQLGEAVASRASNNGSWGIGEAAIILNPEHAQVLARAGLNLSDVAQQVSAFSMKPRRQLHGPAYPPGLDLDVLIGLAPEQLLIMVAGGGGVYSMVVNSWGGGVHQNRHVCAEVSYGASCEVPRPLR